MSEKPNGSYEKPSPAVPPAFGHAQPTVLSAEPLAIAIAEFFRPPRNLHADPLGAAVAEAYVKADPPRRRDLEACLPALEPTDAALALALLAVVHEATGAPLLRRGSDWILQSGGRRTIVSSLQATAFVIKAGAAFVREGAGLTMKRVENVEKLMAASAGQAVDPDPVREFAETCLVPSPGRSIKTRDLYNAYRWWFDRNHGDDSLAHQRTFTERLVDLGWRKKHFRDGNHILDVEIKREETETDDI